MNDLTLEVYRFAGSQLTTELEEIVKAGTLPDGESLLTNGIAREVTIFLENIPDEDNTGSIREKLEAASKDYMSRLKTFKTPKNTSVEEYQRASIYFHSGRQRIGEF